MSGAHSLYVSGCVQALGLRQPLKPALNLAQVEVCALWSHKHNGTRQTCVFSRGDRLLTLTAVPTFWLPSLAPVHNSVPPLPTGLCFGHFLPGHQGGATAVCQA